MIGHLVGWTVQTAARPPPAPSRAPPHAQAVPPPARPCSPCSGASRRMCQAARRSEKVSARSRCPRRSSDLATASHACHAGCPGLPLLSSPPPLSSLPPAHPPRALRYFLLFSRRPRTPRAVRLGGQACALQPRARATLGARGAPRRPRRAATRRRRPRRAPPRRPPG